VQKVTRAEIGSGYDNIINRNNVFTCRRTGWGADVVMIMHHHVDVKCKQTISGYENSSIGWERFCAIPALLMTSNDPLKYFSIAYHPSHISLCQVLC
jgi:hypothetical protein